MTAFETRFDTILPTLATKEDLRAFETRFDTVLPTLATKTDFGQLELKLTSAFMHECAAIRKEIATNNWFLLSRMTVVISLSLTGVFYMARYLPV